MSALPTPDQVLGLTTDDYLAVKRGTPLAARTLGPRERARWFVPSIVAPGLAVKCLWPGCYQVLEAATDENEAELRSHLSRHRNDDARHSTAEGAIV